MKTLAFIIGVLFIALGVFGVSRPGDVLSFGYRMDTPTGLYAAAALRMIVGIVLVAAASSSRMPNTLRVTGGIIALAGLATAFVSVDRVRAVLDWLAAQGPTFVRLPFIIVTAIGAFILSALSVKQHAAAV